MQKEKLTYESLIKKIETKQPISFARYGDGEWNAIFNKNGENCDGHSYFPEMGERLKFCLIQNPEYYLGMQNLALKLRGSEIEKFISDNNILPLEQWSVADILHNASIDGNISKFFNAINTVENLIIVAPPYLKEIKPILNFNHFIEIPEINCYNSIEKISSELYNTLISSIKSEYTVVLIVASMPANIIVDEFYQSFGSKVSFLDVGSVLDPFVNKATRSYHRNLEIRKINNY